MLIFAALALSWRVMVESAFWTVKFAVELFQLPLESFAWKV